MKKLFLVLVAAPLLLTAQKHNTISVYAAGSIPSEVGLSYEFKISKKQKPESTKIINFSSNAMTYKVGNYSVSGSGATISFGNREYFSIASNKSWYFENFLTYSYTDFKDDTINFKGTYSYFSMINPNFGYKAFLSNNITLEPYLGFNWKWEIKNDGDIDNRNIDNLVIKAGLKVGLNF